MECDKFVLEKLEGGDSPDFRAHRAGCAGCARDVEELDDVRRLYHEATEEERWRGGVPALPRRAPSAWIPVAAAAGVAVALLASLFRSEAPRPADPGTSLNSFVRIRLAPWDPEDVRLARGMDDAWERLERLERNAR
jgi:hypothetical protein